LKYDFYSLRKSIRALSTSFIIFGDSFETFSTKDVFGTAPICGVIKTRFHHVSFFTASHIVCIDAWQEASCSFSGIFEYTAFMRSTSALSI